MKAPLEIQTARLLLTPPDANHAEAIFDGYASDPDVTRYLGWPRHRSVADTRGFLTFSAQQWEHWPGGPYLIRSRESGELIGGTGFTFESTEQAITGYVLTKDAWGKGYATEALTAIVRVSRDLGIRRLIAFCHPDHRPSWRVLEKCGFVRDASWSQHIEFPNLAPGVLQPVLRYTIEFDPLH